MDFQIKCETLSNLLIRCRLDKIINDLLLKGENGKLVAKFSDVNRTMYCEVYEPSVKFKADGNIRVPSLSKFIDVLGRFHSDVVRVVSDDTSFVATDGTSVGCGKLKLAQVEVEYIDSYSKIKDTTKKMFDPVQLVYAEKYQYEIGYEIPFDSLLTILKDAKAFGFETYKFFVKDNVLNCTIEDKSVGETFNRKVITNAQIGSGVFESDGVRVSTGFREIIGALDKVKCDDKGKRTVKIYFNKVAILITDGTSFFYNLHALMDS